MKHRRYDQFGEQGVGTSAASEEQMKASGGPGFGGMGGQVDVDLSDIFDAFFNGGASGRGRPSGRKPANSPMKGLIHSSNLIHSLMISKIGDDLQVNFEIPFMTACFGGQEKVRLLIFPNYFLDLFICFVAECDDLKNVELVQAVVSSLVLKFGLAACVVAKGL